MKARPLLLAVAGLVFPPLASAQVIEYYSLDAIGNVRVVTDQQGKVIERHDYLPFGEECTNGPCATNPGVGAGQARKFAGKERDSESGLDYFGARYYGSKIGRFTTTDPVTTLQENLVDPQRWNHYAYARNNPLRYTDPDGRVIDTIADVGFIGWDLFDMGRSAYRGEGISGTQWLALGGDVLGAAIPFATGVGAAIRAGSKIEHAVEAGRAAKAGSELVLDTNVVIAHGKDFVKSGEKVVKSAVSDIEMAGLARRGDIAGVPRAASEIPSVGLPGANTRINVRGGLTPGKRGNFADGIIGATAIERGSTLVTKDKALAGAVEKAGGRVIQP